MFSPWGFFILFVSIWEIPVVLGKIYRGQAHA
jgi:hypothetical protein